MKICGIYKITSPSKKIYIGQSVDCLKRFGSYSRCGCLSQPKLLNSLKKYGYGKHKFEILQQCNRDELSGLEKYYVDLFQTFNNEHGLNIRDGGGNRAVNSEEQKNKTSTSLKLYYFNKKNNPELLIKPIMSIRKGRFSDETRKKMSDAKLGKTTWNKGLHFSEESKIKMSESRRGEKNHNWGIKQSLETKEKNRLSNLGRKHTPEAMAKMKLCWIERRNKKSIA